MDLKNDMCFLCNAPADGLHNATYNINARVCKCAIALGDTALLLAKLESGDMIVLVIIRNVLQICKTEQGHWIEQFLIKTVRLICMELVVFMEDSQKEDIAPVFNTIDWK